MQGHLLKVGMSKVMNIVTLLLLLVLKIQTSTGPGYKPKLLSTTSSMEACKKKKKQRVLYLLVLSLFLNSAVILTTFQEKQRQVALPGIAEELRIQRACWTWSIFELLWIEKWGVYQMGHGGGSYSQQKTLCAEK